MDITDHTTTPDIIHMDTMDTALTGAATDGVDICPTAITGAGGKFPQKLCYFRGKIDYFYERSECSNII